MIRTSFILFFLYSTALFAQQNLCGPSDREVCLSSQADIIFRNTPDFGSFSIVLTVPGVTAVSSSNLQGTPSSPIRLGLEAEITDDQDTTWSGPVILAEDERGPIGIAYRLASGTLLSPFTILVRNVSACQRVSDGPGEVSVNFEIFGSLNKSKKEERLPEMKKAVTFEFCADFSGNLPLADDLNELTVFNPFSYPVMLHFQGQFINFQPGAQLLLQTPINDLNAFASSVSLPMVLTSRQGDLDMVGIGPNNKEDWFLPHLARDSSVWQNEFMFFANQTTSLRWNRDGEGIRESAGAGFHSKRLVVEPGKNTWAGLQTNHGINGFFKFGRTAGQSGSAWVQGASHMALQLYMPHVAQDTAHFWSGISLANPNGVKATVQVAAMSGSDVPMAQQQLEIQPGANYIGLVFSDLFPGYTDVSWLKITSDQPIAGLALVGAAGSDKPWFSGYLLPEESADRLAFARLMSLSGMWSGVAIINAGTSVSNIVLTWYDAEGNIISRENAIVDIGAKWVTLAPEGAVSATAEGKSMIGFCLVGETETGKMASYLGQTW